MTELPEFSAVDIARFQAKFIPEPNSGCWLWFAAADPYGYGRFSIKIGDRWTTVLAHRASWHLCRGSIGDLFVLHDCDTPSCVNPDHLFLGTQGDNMADCSAKGRAVGNRGLVVGERHGLHKLTWGMVDEIRASDLPQRDLSTQFGVHQTLISLVQRRKIWKEENRHAN